MYIDLTGPRAHAVAALREATDAALAATPPELTVGVDRLEGLDAPVLAGLISALRRLRELGGTLRVLATRPDAIRTLEVTGLDRVFTVVTEWPLDEPAASQGAGVAGSFVRRAATGLVAGLIALLAATLPGGAQGNAELTPDEIVARMIERNPSLHSYEARLEARVRTGIPFLNPTVEGRTYFKRPDLYEVVLTKVPSYAKGFEKVFGETGDPSSWQKRYTMSLAGETEVNGHKDLVVRLVKRQRGQIDHEDVAIDPATWEIERMSYAYYNGGAISIEQEFREDGGFRVLSDQYATIDLPHVPHATASSHFSDYRFNVAIDDAVFTRSREHPDEK